MNGCSLGLAGIRGMLKSIIKGWSGSVSQTPIGTHRPQPLVLEKVLGRGWELVHIPVVPLSLFSNPTSLRLADCNLRSLKPAHTQVISRMAEATGWSPGGANQSSINTISSSGPSVPAQTPAKIPRLGEVGGG